MTPMDTEASTPGAVPALSRTPLAQRALDLVTREEVPALVHHSVRTALFARMYADHRGAEPGRDYDPELLQLACVLHDIGLSERGNGDQRFEVDGADAAAEFLTAEGLPADRVDAVWDAIALHTSPGIAERRSLLCELVRRGVVADFGGGTEFVPDEVAAAVFAAHPRLSLATALADEIVAQARVRPGKAPRYSLAGELLRERSTPPHVTVLETETAASRWGA